MKPLISKAMTALAIVALSCIAFEKTATAQCPPGSIPPGTTLASEITTYPYGDNPAGSGINSTAIPSTFLVDVTTANQALPVGLYEAWCVDETTELLGTPAFYSQIPGTPYTGLLYPTCDPSLNSATELGQYITPSCPHINSSVSPQVWLEVDYILNYYNSNPGVYSFWDVQAAINTFVGSESNSFNPYCNEVLSTPLPDGCGGYPYYNTANVNFLVSNAQYNVVSKGWMPVCGDVVGVVYVTPGCSQFIVIAVPFTAPPTITITPGKNEGCGGSNLVPTDITILSTVTVTPGCCAGKITTIPSHVDSSNGCFWQRMFTIVATDACGLSATNTATYTWVNDTTPPVFTKVPTAGFEGCGLTNVPNLAQVQGMVTSNLITATATCGSANIMVTSGGLDTTNQCTATRVFILTAYDSCLNTVTNLTYSYTIQTNINTKTITTNVTTTITVTTNNCTNTVCGNLNCQNTWGCQWVWLNSHITCNPGQPCTVYCKNASVTITCGSGRTYTYSCPDGQINFSSSCNAGSSSFDGTKWNTTLPCAGDSEIFLQGCSIPWNSDFANCKNVCWSGVFSCSNPQINCSFDWGNSCYNSKQPSCGSITPKPCYQTSCQNGSYNYDGNHAGCPENYQSSCISGYGYNQKSKDGSKDIGNNWNDGGNWNCSWNTSPICCGNLITNYTYVTNYTTNVTTTTQCCSTTPPCTTKSICQGFNSQNPSGGWLWCNANINCQPNKQCTVYCHNATITVACNDGNTYTYPVPDCQVNFSPKCSQASCSYNNGSWTTTVPTCGDDQIFLSGCGVPWKSEFANCKNVTWSGTFCCDTPGINCNWQWSSSCYNYNLGNCSSANIKPCHTLSCSYNNNDQCGTPRNCKNYCWGGGCGSGGSNWTGSWSSKGSCW